jgi:hypothetical protein
VQGEVESGPSAARSRRTILGDEPGRNLFRQMLAIAMWLRPKYFVSSATSTGRPASRDVPEDLVAGRIAQRSRLFLQRRRHGSRRPLPLGPWQFFYHIVDLGVRGPLGVAPSWARRGGWWLRAPRDRPLIF